MKKRQAKKTSRFKVKSVVKNVSFSQMAIDAALTRAYLDPAAQLAGATKFTSLVRWLVMRYIAGSEL